MGNIAQSRLAGCPKLILTKTSPELDHRPRARRVISRPSASVASTPTGDLATVGNLGRCLPCEDGSSIRRSEMYFSLETLILNSLEEARAVWAWATVAVAEGV